MNPSAIINIRIETPETKYIANIAAANTEAEPISFCNITTNDMVMISIIIIGINPSTGLFNLVLFFSIQAATNNIVPSLKTLLAEN